jgi:hypothetical protein
MAGHTSHEPWPPTDGRAFICSDSFGRLLLRLTSELAARYTAMDFTDAVAHVFVWFDQKLEAEPHFISDRRFPTLGAFSAYLRQAIWNAARLAERERRRRERIQALPADRPIVCEEPSPQELAALLETVDRLPEPHRTIFDKIFFEEDKSVAMLAAVLARSDEEIVSIYEEAIDMLGA